MSLTKQTLNNFLNDTFVETGTCEGDGVAIALECGFKTIYSIEIDPVLYDYCKKRFADKDNVYLYKNDSIVVLPQILSEIQTPSTFWLDAHMNDVSTYVGKFRCPILQEIDMILDNNLHHTLLIDDRRLFMNDGIRHWNNVKEKEIMDTIRGKSDKLKISYACGVVENDIIVVKHE